jgi:hypothetical protein
MTAENKGSQTRDKPAKLAIKLCQIQPNLRCKGGVPQHKL